MAMSGKMHFVLDSGKKCFSCGRLQIIVNGCGINISNLLIEVALAFPYISDFKNQIFEILFA